MYDPLLKPCRYTGTIKADTSGQYAHVRDSAYENPAGIAAIVALASCSKEQAEKPVSVSSQLGMKAGLLGTWKQIAVNDEYCLTNLRTVKTFFADGTETVSNSKYSESKGGWMWRNKEAYNFTIVGNQIHENSTVSSVVFTTTVLEMRDNRIEYTKTNDTEGFIGDRHSNGVLARVDDNYFQYDIIGTWDGVPTPERTSTMNGGTSTT